MIISYIIDKDGFCFLYEILGGDKSNIPEKIYADTSDEEYETTEYKLEKQGYVHVQENRIDIERTIRFLVVSVINAVSVVPTKSGGYIFDCTNLFVVIEEDKLAPKKCKITPIKDKEMLNEYFEESEEET